MQRLGHIAPRDRERAFEVGCLKDESSYVVPAKAGTHSHRRSLLWKVSNSVPQRDDTVYGSLLSQGRRKGADGLPFIARSIRRSSTSEAETTKQSIVNKPRP